MKIKGKELLLCIIGLLATIAYILGQVNLITLDKGIEHGEAFFKEHKVHGRLMHDTIYYPKDYDYVVRRRTYLKSTEYESVLTLIHDGIPVDTLALINDRRDYWTTSGSLYFAPDTVYFMNSLHEWIIQSGKKTEKCFFVPPHPTVLGESNQFFEYFENLGEYYPTGSYRMLMREIENKGYSWDMKTDGDINYEKSRNGTGGNIIVIPLSTDRHPRINGLFYRNVN